MTTAATQTPAEEACTLCEGRGFVSRRNPEDGYCDHFGCPECTDVDGRWLGFEMSNADLAAAVTRIALEK